MKFYIRKADLDLADDRCDLGDSVPARVYLYPHKDMLPDLQECTTIDSSLCMAAKEKGGVG